MSVSEKNRDYLQGVMFPFITEEFKKASDIRNTRSVKPDETYATQSMLIAMFGKFSEEVANLLHGLDDTQQEKFKTIENQHKIDKESWNEVREDLLNQIDNLSQYSRRDNLKILGVPVTDVDNINEIVVDIVKHTGVDLVVDDISIAHRINTKDDAAIQSGPLNRPTKVPSIICKLKSRTKRSEIFQARKFIKLKPAAPHREAAIYDDVTPLRSRIMYALRNHKVEGVTPEKKKYEFVWSRDGRIFCRTHEESQAREIHPITGKQVMPKPHIVNKPQDLEKLGWSPSEIQDIINNIRH